MHERHPSRPNLQPDSQPSPLPDRQAEFAHLVERHAAFLFRVAYSRLGNRPDAEDAVQDTLLKLYRTGAWRQPMTEERAYLARAVWRASLDRQSAVSARVLREAGDVEELPLASAALDPEAEALAASDRALLHRLLARLPDELRQCLLLSAIEGISGREIGTALGVAEATVRTRVFRARAELRRMFLQEAALTQEVRR